MEKKFAYRHSESARKTSLLHYRLSGKGKPVMLIHGFGEDSRVWDDTISVLEKNYKIIVPDLPGSGKSEMLQKAKPGISDYADSLLAILDKEKIKSCCLIGHSMGGYITASFVNKYPERVKAFALYHSSTYADTAEKKINRDKAIRFIEQNGATKFIKTLIPDLFYQKTKSKSLIKEQIERGKAFENKALIQYLHAMKTRPDRSVVLKKSTVPIGFILGRHDKTIPIETGLKQSLLSPTAHVFILEKSAHMGMLEETETASGYLEQFLQNI